MCPFKYGKRHIMKTIILILLCCISANAFSQISISGNVLDENSEAVPFVNVWIVGSNFGTSTDLNGNFLIQLPASISGDTIVMLFTSVGYDSTIIKVKATGTEVRNLVVVMGTSYILLESVVVKSEMPEFNVVQSVSGVVASVSVQSNKKNKNTYAYSETISSSESYKGNPENKFKSSKEEPLTTLSIDVDNASYTNIRRMINNGQTPPADAVRVEEMINYFNYNYPQPTDDKPFTVYTEYSECPWNPEHKLLHVGIQGKKIATENLPKANLVFLIDVSGSMADQNKLPLVKSSLKLLVDNLREEDRVAIVVYAGNAGEVLSSTSGSNKEKIMDAINRLESGGSTAGGAGIELAYKIAESNFMKNGNNRVILCTDGDFNVGISGDDDLQKLIESKRDLGIFLTCLGYGMGNYKDSKLEILADKGNGNYGYIDNLQEANKMLVTGLGGTLYTIAKDVKIQIEFNPSEVVAYRLIGYENRLLNTEDFTDDKKDAGELGAGQTVTTIYEIIPAGVEDKFTQHLPKLKYQKNELTVYATNKEIATVKFRYKKPDEKESNELIYPVSNNEILLENSTEIYRFSAAVALFGMLLEKSEFSGNGNYEMVIDLAQNAKADDADGYKAEFVRLAQVVK